MEEWAKQTNGGGGNRVIQAGGGSNYGSGGMGGNEFNLCNTTGVQGYPGVALSNGGNKILWAAAAVADLLIMGNP